MSISNAIRNMSNTVRKMILIMLVSALVIAIGGVIVAMFFSETLEPILFGVGVFISTGINIIKVIWLEQAVEVATAMEDGQMATNHIRKHSLLRFVFMTAVLITIGLVGNVNLLLGAIFGLFTFYPAKYALPIIIKGESAEADA